MTKFYNKITTFLLTLNICKSAANDLLLFENPYLNIYVTDTFSPWGRHELKKGKRVILLICMVNKMMPQILLWVASFWPIKISK